MCQKIWLIVFIFFLTIHYAQANGPKVQILDFSSGPTVTTPEEIDNAVQDQVEKTNSENFDYLVTKRLNERTENEEYLEENVPDVIGDSEIEIITPELATYHYTSFYSDRPAPVDEESPKIGGE